MKTTKKLSRSKKALGEVQCLSCENAQPVAKKPTNYVMFGFNKDDIDDTGYLGKSIKEGGKMSIVQDIHDAKLFPDVPPGKSGSPKQWLDFWNLDESNNFKFHLVKTSL